MSVPSHVIFDLDGTITDSAPGIVASLRHALTAEGLPVPSDDALLGAIGPPFEVGLPALGVPRDRLFSVIAHYRERYEQGGLFESRVYEGVIEMLDVLAASDVVLAVATAKPEPTARRVVEHFQLTDRFTVLAGATFEGVPGRRTKAEVLTHALTELGVAGGPTIVMVGDRDHDILAARELGLRSIGVTWGYGTLDELTTAGAPDLAASPADVVALLGAAGAAGTGAIPRRG